MQALRFRVGERWLAVDVRWVREVCPFVRVRSLPGGPAWLRGLFDFHGSLLPAVDAGLLLGSEAVTARLGARLLLLEGPCHDRADAPHAIFGLLVDAVDGVTSVQRGEAWTPRDGMPERPFLREVVRCEGAETLLLDAARLAGQHAAVLTGADAPALPPSGASEP